MNKVSELRLKEKYERQNKESLFSFELVLKGLINAGPRGRDICKWQLSVDIFIFFIYQFDWCGNSFSFSFSKVSVSDTQLLVLLFLVSSSFKLT